MGTKKYKLASMYSKGCNVHYAHPEKGEVREHVKPGQILVGECFESLWKAGVLVEVVERPVVAQTAVTFASRPKPSAAVPPPQPVPAPAPVPQVVVEPPYRPSSLADQMGDMFVSPFGGGSNPVEVPVEAGVVDAVAEELPKAGGSKKGRKR